MDSEWKFSSQTQIDTFKPPNAPVAPATIPNTGDSNDVKSKFTVVVAILDYADVPPKNITGFQ